MENGTTLSNKIGGSIGLVNNGGTFINELGATVTGNVGNSNADGNLIKSTNFGTIGGNLTVSGGSFTQAGTLTGTAIVNATGTLIFGNGGTVGNFSSNLRTGGIGLVNNGKVVFDSTDRDAIISGVISGSGSVENRGGNGNGAVTLSGNNTYTGKTIVNSGFLALKGTFATSAFEVNNSGIIVIDRDVDTNFNTSVTGTGGFLKRGTGTMTLTGPLGNTGVVAVGGGRLLAETSAGAGANNGINMASVLEVSNGGEILLGVHDTKVGGLRGFVNGSGVSGVISGNGNIEINTAANTTNQLTVALGGNGRSITKTGAGTQEFYGANTYTGGTTIKAGILKVGSSGALGTGAIAVESGANLELGTLGNFAGADFTFDKIITGAGGLIKTSTNTVTLSAVNTYTGDTQIKEGTLKLSGTGKIALASKIVISAGANFDIGTTVFETNTLGNIGGNLRGAGTVTLNFTAPETFTGKISDGLANGEKFKLEVKGGSALTLTGDNSFTGGLEISGHDTKVILGSNNAAGGANNTIITRGTIINYANGVNSPTPITIDSQTTQLEVNGTDIATQSGSIGEAFITAPLPAAGEGRPLEKIGIGTLILTAANTYTGVTTITAGTLNIQNAAGLGANGAGAAASGTVVAAGAALELQGGISIGAEALTLNGTGVAGGGALRNVAGSNTYGGAITLASNSTIITNGDRLDLNRTIALDANNLTLGGTGWVLAHGVISGTGGVIINSGGIVGINVANTYTGGTTLTAGDVEVAAVATLGAAAGALTVNGGRLLLNGNLTVGSLAGTGGVITTQGGAARDFTVSGATTTAYSGVLQDNGADKLKTIFTGGGTTTLSGSNTLTGGIEIAGTGTRVNFANTASTGGATNTLTLSGTNNVLGLTGAANTIYNSPIALTGTGAKLDVTNDIFLRGVVSGTGGFEKLGTGTLILGDTMVSPINTFSGAFTISAGTVAIKDNTNLGNDSATNRLILNGGTLDTGNNVVGMARPFTVNAAAGTVNNLQLLALQGNGNVFTGALTKTGTGVLVLTGTGSGTGGINVNAGALSLGNDSSAGRGVIALAANTELRARVNGINITNNIALTGAGSRILGRDFGGVNYTLWGNISGNGGILKPQDGIIDLRGFNTFTGGVTLASGTLGVGTNTALGTGILSAQIGTTLRAVGTPGTNSENLSLANNIVITLGMLPTNQFTVDTNGFNMTLSGVISTNVPQVEPVQPGLTKTGAGNLTLTGTNTYRGATIVNAGKLIVNGSIANTSSVTIANGAVLGGNAAIPNLTVQSGATLSPGNSIGVVNIVGNLTLNAGSTTLIEIQGSTVDKINAGGRATVAGTLQLVALGGTYLFASPYNFLTVSGGVNGTFATVTTDAAFGVGVTSTVTYNATNAFVTLNAAPLVQTLTAPSTAPNTLALSRPKNVFAVASGMDRAVANGANASAFFNVYNQPTREALAAAVNTLSGEIHTAGNAMGVQASDQFLRIMLDPTAIGRDGRMVASTDLTTASLKGQNQAVLAAPTDAGRYRVWGAVFGESARVDGDAFTIGSARAKTSDAHVAVGTDIAIMPGTTVGIAASGGQSETTLANGMGSGKADIYQIGLYGMSKVGAFTFGASAAYTSLQMETNRSVPVLGVNSVKANYRTEAWSGRIEGAWAAAKFVNVTFSPIAGLQVQSVNIPGFTETNGLTGAAFGVTSLGTTNTTLRTELGLKLDMDTMVGASQVNLYAKAAWGHYVKRDVAFSASLIGIAGANFTVEGAKPARDAALLSIGADLKVTPHMTLGANFDTELSSTTQSYSGSAKLRYAF